MTVREVQMICLFLGLLMGNVASVTFTDSWEKCWDRSFFQGIALLAWWLANRIFNGEENEDDTGN